jgi:hypothetical protein
MALLLARSVQMCVARSTLPLAVFASSSSSSFARCFSSDAAATPAAASTEASAFQAFASSTTMQCEAAKRLVTAFATDAPDMRVGAFLFYSIYSMLFVFFKHKNVTLQAEVGPLKSCVSSLSRICTSCGTFC